MLPESQTTQNPWRKRRLTFYTLAALLLVLSGARALFRGELSPGGVGIYLSSLVLLFSLAQLEGRDYSSLREEEEAVAADEKHLFRLTVGLSHSADIRRRIAYSLLALGISLIYRGLDGRFFLDTFVRFGCIFWGALACLGGCIVWLTWE